MRVSRSSSHQKRGFILLESIIALAILATMLAVIYRTVGAGAHGVERADEKARVLDLLQSDLDGMIAGGALRSGSGRAALNAHYDRTRSISKVAVPSASLSGSGVSLYRIELTAFRNSEQGRPILTLQAFRLQRGGDSP